MSPGGMPPGGAATTAGSSPGAGGTARRRWRGRRYGRQRFPLAVGSGPGTGTSRRRSAPAAGFAWICRSARTAAACSAAVLASAADWAETTSAWAACSLMLRKLLHLCRHLGGHHPLDRQLVDQALRRVGGQHGVHAVGSAAHVLRGSKLIDRRLEGCQLRFGRVDRRLVGRVLRVGGLLCCQLVIQVELCRMHRLGGPLGLPRQFVELCQRVISRVCLHIPGEHACRRL